MLDDQLLITLMALLLSAVVGGILPLTALVSQGIKRLERKLNREWRPREERRRRGMLLAGGVVVASMLGGLLTEKIISHLPLVDWLNVLLLALLLPGFSLYRFASTTRQLLMEGLLHSAQEKFSGSIWRNHALLDEYGLNRAIIEQLITQFTERMIAPLFYFLWFGWAGALLAIGISLLHDAIGRRHGEGGEFGYGAMQIHQLLQYLPERITAFCWVVASHCLPGMDAANAMRCYWQRVMHLRPYPQLLFPVVAASMRICLGGPLSPHLSDWSGAGRARVTSIDTRLASRMLALNGCWFFVILGLFYCL